LVRPADDQSSAAKIIQFPAEFPEHLLEFCALETLKICAVLDSELLQFFLSNRANARQSLRTSNGAMKLETCSGRTSYWPFVFIDFRGDLGYQGFVRPNTSRCG